MSAIYLCHSGSMIYLRATFLFCGCFKGVSFYSFDDIELFYSCDDIELNASLEESDVCCNGSILVAANSTCLFIGMPEPWHKSLPGGLYKNTL